MSDMIYRCIVSSQKHAMLTGVCILFQAHCTKPSPSRGPVILCRAVFFKCNVK